MFIQLHSLRSFPPHIPNRGADGLAKRAVFGGHERQRISYQCHQHALRTHPSIDELNSKLGQTARSTLIPSRWFFWERVFLSSRRPIRALIRMARPILIHPTTAQTATGGMTVWSYL